MIPDKALRRKVILFSAIILFILLNIELWIWPGWDKCSWPEIVFDVVSLAWFFYALYITLYVEKDKWFPPSKKT